MTLIFVNKWVTENFFPTIEHALLRQDVCKLCQSFYFKHRLTVGLCIGECTLSRKRIIMQETIARKQKLVQGYQKDLMLLRRTHAGGEWYIEQSIRDAQEELDIWEGMYRVQMEDRWALIMIAEGYCHSELTYYELISYGRYSMLKKYRCDYGYYGPTQYKRFIQRMAHCGDKAIFCNIVSFL